MAGFGPGGYINDQGAYANVPSAPSGGGGLSTGTVGAGLGVIGGVLGSIFGTKKPPSAKDLARMFGPGVLTGDIQKIYDMLSKSPQFAQLLTQNNINASGFEHNLRGSLGARGLTSSGVGSIATAASQSAAGTGEQALRGGLFATAADQAQQNLLARLQAYMQGQGQAGPSPLAQIGGSLASAGSFLGLL